MFAHMPSNSTVILFSLILRSGHRRLRKRGLELERAQNTAFSKPNAVTKAGNKPKHFQKEAKIKVKITAPLEQYARLRLRRADSKTRTWVRGEARIIHEPH